MSFYKRFSRATVHVFWLYTVHVFWHWIVISNKEFYNTSIIFQKTTYLCEDFERGDSLGFIFISTLFWEPLLWSYLGKEVFVWKQFFVRNSLEYLCDILYTTMKCNIMWQLGCARKIVTLRYLHQNNCVFISCDEKDFYVWLFVKS